MYILLYSYACVCTYLPVCVGMSMNVCGSECMCTHAYAWVGTTQNILSNLLSSSMSCHHVSLVRGST